MTIAVDEPRTATIERREVPPVVDYIYFLSQGSSSGGETLTVMQGAQMASISSSDPSNNFQTIKDLVQEGRGSFREINELLNPLLGACRTLEVLGYEDIVINASNGAVVARGGEQVHAHMAGALIASLTASTINALHVSKIVSAIRWAPNTPSEVFDMAMSLPSLSFQEGGLLCGYARFAPGPRLVVPGHRVSNWDNSSHANFVTEAPIRYLSGFVTAFIRADVGHLEIGRGRGTGTGSLLAFEFEVVHVPTGLLPELLSGK